MNYGTIDDFLYLTNGTFLELNLSKYICIARYGSIYRGDKVIMNVINMLIFICCFDEAPFFTERQEFS